MAKLTQSQQRGLLVLLVIVALFIGWRWRAATLSAGEGAAGAADPSQARQRVELNAADTTALQGVQGIGPVLARRIVRYRALVGGFTSTDQLLNVFGLSPENLVRIEEQVYVDTTTAAFAALRAGMPRRGGRPRHAAGARSWQEAGAQAPAVQPAATADLPTGAAPPAAAKQPRPAVDINLADSAALVMVPGIGPATARNIVKYRALVFHYHSLDQLQEVWGVRPENLERMLPHLKVGDTEGLPHIRVNEMTVDEMGRHKYLGFKDARIIVAYRDKHGPYTGVTALMAVNELSPQVLAKIEPYLEF